MQDEIRLLGPLHCLSGYSKMTRAVLTTALRAGYRVEAIESDFRTQIRGLSDGRTKYLKRYEPPLFVQRKKVPRVQRRELAPCLRTKVRPDAPILMIQLPHRLHDWPDYSEGPRIGWTMLESDRINPKWQIGMRGVDLLLAPSQYCLESFRRDVPNIRSELMPLPVDGRLWGLDGDNSSIGVANHHLPAFTFLSVFGAYERKQWRILIQAFAEEFCDEGTTDLGAGKKRHKVGLILNPTGDVGAVHQCAGWGVEMGCWITVIHRELEEETMAAYYEACDCFALVSPEGFGLPFVEAAMAGKPSIALDDGGACDFVTPDVGYPVEAERKPLYGHMFHQYPSDQRFALPKDITAVRRAFREAYEDRARKGAAARERAAQFTPEALAPRFRELIDSACDDFRRRKVMFPVGIDLPKWAVCVGDGFGDAIGSYGNALHVLDETGCADIGMIHYGWSRGVSEFLRLQPKVREVRQVVPIGERDKEFATVANNSGGHYAMPRDSWLPLILKSLPDVEPDSVALTQIHWQWGSWPVYRPDNLVLSSEAEEWAEEQAKQIGPFILVQPFSTNSVGLGEHWHGWHPFLSWLVSRVTKTKLVFCGLNHIDGLDGRPNCVDLIGKSASMQHVFALADRSIGCITTCNALAHWTAVRGIKGLVAGNQAIPRDNQFWTRFLKTPNNTYLPLQTSLKEFIAAAEDWLEEVIR